MAKSASRVPEPATSFVGRDQELETIRELFEKGARLVTVLGPGGVGKTRLALRFAASTSPRSGAVVVCDLTEATSLGDLCTSLARALGVMPTSSDETGTVAQLGRALAASPSTLLLLDNLEQIVAEAAPAISELLARAPALAILTTSRVRLRATGEFVVDLAPLPEPEAVRLFIERARQVAPRWGEGSADGDVVAAMVRRLDGFPLAIELCATRSRVLDPASLRARLEQGFDALDTGPRDVSVRHGTLGHAIEWSVRSLPERERVAFQQCAVFGGGFTLEAAEAVLDPGGPSALDALSGLVDASLLLATAGRFSMYSAIRDHAARALAESGAAARHARYYLELGERLLREAPDLERPRLLLERDNLAAVHARAAAHLDDPAQVEVALRAALVLDDLLEVSGQHVFDRIDEPLRAAERLGAPAELVARALWARGRASLIGRTHDAVRDGERAVQLAAEIGDRVTEARACATLGVAYRILRRIDEARAMGERAVAVSVGIDAPRIQARARNALAGLLYETGDLDRAGALLLEAEEISRRIGDRWMEAWTVAGRAHLLHEQGDLPAAVESFERASALFETLRDDSDAAICTGYRAAVLHERGDHEAACAAYLEVADRLGRLDNPRFEGLFRACAGAAAAAIGRDGQARTAFEAAERLLAPLGDPALHLALEIHRLHLEIPGSRDASTALSKCRALTEKSALVAQSDDVRLALRILHRAIAAMPRDAADGRSLRLALGSRWFEPPGGPRTVLARKRALWLLLHALADARLRSPGRVLSADALLAAGWPDERILPTAGAHRVQVAIATLRNSGLRAILLSRSGGYLIDPTAPVELLPD